MRISDWSSDVCSSDLTDPDQPATRFIGSCPHWPATAQALRKPAAPCSLAIGKSSKRISPPGLQTSRGASAACPPAASMMRHRKRSEEHTSELQSLMRISYAVFCLKKKKKYNTNKR